ncbi:cobalamin biosynthesis protein [Rhizobium sp. RM]|uniref:cobalamin biosynthesis protein n=1 Tax=Rhizobium sp. RM TaxID=2748079 RepID=UPI003365555D
MIVAGIGCRKGVGGDAIVAALRAAQEAFDVNADFLATAPIKADEPGIKSAARQLGMRLLVADQVSLDAAAARVLTISEVSLTHTGSPSVSEASALAVAGKNSKLVAPRFVVGDITVAFAISGEET